MQLFIEDSVNPFQNLGLENILFRSFWIKKTSVI